MHFLQFFFSLQLLLCLHFEFLLLPPELSEELLFFQLHKLLLLFLDLFFFAMAFSVLSFHVSLHLFNDPIELSLLLPIFFFLLYDQLLLLLQLRIYCIPHL